ncbi:MAG: shikimate kinase [Acidimicrobiia bacterium]|nr:shikimate kinase [Acidimicrobiia bacterium]
MDLANRMTSTASSASTGRALPVAPGKSVVLVGLMGAGKSSVGRRLAKILDLPFVDADEEIERAAGCSIEDIFRLYGEPAFRDGEERVIARLLESGPQVLATGGGAFMNPRTRERIRERAISIWLRADLELLVRRTARRGGRPLLAHGDPRATLERLMAERYPVYAEADMTVDTTDENIERMVDRILAGLHERAEKRVP